MAATDSGDGLRVIRSGERDRWRDEHVDSRQSFPATGAFDLAANAFGVLLVHNDDVVAPGEGFDAHQHANVEIVTWVVEGALRHRDSQGTAGVIPPGTAQRMSAGERVVHSEHNASGRLDGRRLRVVQMWIAPDAAGGPVGYAQRDFTAELAGGRPVTVVSGLARDAGSGAVGIGNSQVALHAARPAPGAAMTLPAAPYLHLYVVRGAVQAEAAGRAVALAEGDALRATHAGPVTVTGAGDGPAEILAWEMHAAVAVRSGDRRG